MFKWHFNGKCGGFVHEEHYRGFIISKTNKQTTFFVVITQKAKPEI